MRAFQGGFPSRAESAPQSLLRFWVTGILWVAHSKGRVARPIEDRSSISNSYNHPGTQSHLDMACLKCVLSGAIWVWVKLKPIGDRRFWSIFPFARVPFWVPIFDPQPSMGGLAVGSLGRRWPEWRQSGSSRRSPGNAQQRRRRCLGVSGRAAERGRQVACLKSKGSWPLGFSVLQLCEVVVPKG